MTLPQEVSVTKTPIGIGVIVVFIQTDGAGYESIKGNFEILLSDGTTKTRIIDLANHLTQTQINQIRVFADNIRSRAVSEMIPPRQ